MSPDKMIRMANQIATFFKSQPGDAPEKIADHLRDFWEPRMRQQLLSYISQGGEGLDELVTKAALRL
ncbi:formate dehydrogenase subunit delta [Paracoccus sp. 11-3]|uniref:Formate dehydrogenase subunit delta n=1 Tax=Paracoccus amoyensis TaxID=2760093 RepID=A0A926GB83_9RHOB|nr:formate dehydrogenase subunit delta [Paracoccus amoyensis]MBC9245865.1 formate dehydrogenase subunit delta [Paracoccus amoyensis]